MHVKQKLFVATQKYRNCHVKDVKSLRSHVPRDSLKMACREMASVIFRGSETSLRLGFGLAGRDFYPVE